MDQYTKRTLNGIFLLFLLIPLFSTVLLAVLNGNMKAGEAWTVVNSNLPLIVIPLVLCIKNILCLRGDRPAAECRAEKDECKSDFVHAVDLVTRLSSEGFCLGGACYPEMHPESAHITDDILHLKEKVDAGLHFLTTQMFFDNNVYFHFLSRLRDAGVTVPVIAGIMPVTNGKQIKRICDLAGTYLPPRFRAIVDRFGDDPVAMLDAGVAYATEQIIDLFANGVNFVHVYTMNKPEIARRVMGNLKGIVSGS